jgi:hypothetical protein
MEHIMSQTAHSEIKVGAGVKAVATGKVSTITNINIGRHDGAWATFVIMDVPGGKSPMKISSKELCMWIDQNKVEIV